MKRIFVGLPVTPEFSRVAERLRERATGVRWIPTRNLHITVEFLGPTSDAQLEVLGEQLQKIAIASFGLHVTGLIALPEPRRARVIAIAFDPAPSFDSLYRHVRSSAAAAGLPLKPPRVSPHLTLARLRRPDRKWLAGYLENYRQVAIEMPRIDVTQVNVYESVLSPSGAEYTALSGVQLRSPHGLDSQDHA